MFEKKYRLRPRVHRTMPIMEIGLVVTLGIVSGIYIFKDTIRRAEIPTPPEPKSE